MGQHGNRLVKGQQAKAVTAVGTIGKKSNKYLPLLLLPPSLPPRTFLLKPECEQETSYVGPSQAIGTGRDGENWGPRLQVPEINEQERGQQMG